MAKNGIFAFLYDLCAFVAIASIFGRKYGPIEVRDRLCDLPSRVCEVQVVGGGFGASRQLQLYKNSLWVYAPISLYYTYKYIGILYILPTYNNA
jgi:hypothetical protein